MIPRLHKRGTSFKGACSYILHDAGKATSDRVLWAETCNLASAPEDAWFEMFAVTRDQALLKEQAGQQARGRKNTKPVLHYTLSWPAADNPTPEHMRATALASLQALKLDGHQAVISAHGDKDHMHVHIVVNTIHPETGMTAPMKFTKEALSRWAEAYEREHGVHCEERIRNNEVRDQIRIAKNATKQLRQSLAELQQDMPYVPVKHKAAQREDWLDRKDIIDRMRQLRREMEPLLPQTGMDMEALWKRQSAERDILDQNSEAAVDHARSCISERYRPQWKALYRAHRKQTARIEKDATHPFERAVFVFQNRERLGDGKPLTLRQMVPLILKPEKLMKRVLSVQERERRSLARAEKSEKRDVARRIWDQHKYRFETLRARQKEERVAARSEREAQLRFVVTFDLAKETLLAERKAAKLAQSAPAPAPEATQEFNTSVNTRSPQQMARVEAIKRQMEAWRLRNPGRDFGREM